VADSYVELHCHSAYSLLDGTSTPAALVEQAAALEMPALALTDHNALYGAIPFVAAAEHAGVQPILGAELTIEDGCHLTLLVQDATGWRNLCELITIGQAVAPKGEARVPWGALLARAEGLICLSGCAHGPLATALARWDRQEAFRLARALRQAFTPKRCYVELQHHLHPGDARRVEELARLAGYLDLPVVATNNVHYAHRGQQRLHDTLVAIRRRLSLASAEPVLRPNDEYYLKRGPQLRPLFAARPEALAASARIAARCTFRLAFGLQDLPRFPTPPGCMADDYLQQLCARALPVRYGSDCAAAAAQLRYELAVIARAGLANYFLIVWDLVAHARKQGIRCQGRGSAANAIVAYLLAISPIDPLRHGLVFERFLSAERPVLPDIDIDVDAARREELIQYLYSRYGTQHVALACTLITFQARSALADIARALDLAPAQRDEAEELLAEGGEEAASDEAVRLLLELCREVRGLPRHLGQHSGGMVLMGQPIAERLPVEPTAMAGRSVVQWDKDALETAGIVKIDLLGLRMLSAITEALELLAASTGQRPQLERLSYDDPEIYALLAAADTIGVFQVESRAQASVLPRLQPRRFEDIVVAISLIRPGPLQGQMVHPYLRRRQGVEIVSYTHPCLEPVLRDTLGVLLFQEQVLLVAEAVAGWSLGRGEVLRRALARRDEQAVAALRATFLADAEARGVGRATAMQVFAQLEAFAGYSFPRSHAAAFAVLVYQSAYLKRYAPAAFFCALLNNQPMGFWPPSVLVGDAKRRGVRLLPPDIERSAARSTLEDGAIRLGLLAVRGLGEAGCERVLAARAAGRFANLRDLVRRTGLPRNLLARLILAGACDGWGRARGALLGELGTLGDVANELPLELEPLPLPPLTERAALVAEEAVLGLNVSAHVVAPLRSWLRREGYLGSKGLARVEAGQRVRVAGRLIIHQAPPTAKGHHFLTLEDEHGLVDVILRPPVVERCRAALREQAELLAVTGMLQREGGVTSVLAWRVEALATPA
jgi:error-prone DNA polymerase